MDEKKKYLSLEGLQRYDERLKAYVDAQFGGILGCFAIVNNMLCQKIENNGNNETLNA